MQNLLQIELSVSGTLMELKLKIHLHVVKYTLRVQKIPLGGVQVGAGPPNVNLGPPNISETTTARS